MLNNEEHRRARETVFRLAKEYKQNHKLKIFFKSEVENVRADFDVAGALVKANSIHKNISYMNTDRYFSMLELSRRTYKI